MYITDLCGFQSQNSLTFEVVNYRLTNNKPAITYDCSKGAGITSSTSRITDVPIGWLRLGLQFFVVYYASWISAPASKNAKYSTCKECYQNIGGKTIRQTSLHFHLKSILTKCMCNVSCSVF